MIVVELLFWLCAGLIVYTHAGYPLVLYLLTSGRRADKLRQGQLIGPSAGGFDELPTVSLIVPAYDEEEVIADKVVNALALEYPRERLQIIVASDGSADATVERARAAG
ncbi:MAG TPA: glycosyltransferase, partial [Solirubrobacterales bacterium]|nr:glycosyltransferase [Solirubrobacterales bacterium]